MGAPHEQPAQVLSSQPGEDIDLEPTLLAESTTSSSDTRSADRSSDYASAGMDGEFTHLLRTRLLAAAGYFLVCHIILSVFDAVSPSSLAHALSHAVITSLAMRTVVAALVVGVLMSPRVLSRRQLRALECFLFGMEVLIILITQYLINTTLVDQGDGLSMVAFQKNGVLRVIVIMLVYGVLIPNSPKITARAVITMAASLIVVHRLVLDYELKTNSIVDRMTDSQNAISNALFLLMGAALAIFSAYILRGLRREVREARRLGQYQLLEKLAAGGMGEVYLAEHQLLKRPCALKLIHPDLENDSIAMARFEREVQSAAMLSHPNTIEVFDYGHSDDGTFYYVMEYLPGLSISDLVRQAGPMPPGRAVYIMRQVCGSLAEAHCAGLVHRDLKPANIFVAVLGGQCDVAKVLDFGLVKQQNPSDGRQLTAMYTVSGTPSYMSPEQAVGSREIDGRADLYSLGAILYFMLTGEPPFARETPMALMVAHASEPVRPPSQIRPDVPADLEAIVLRCLAKQPADRFPDARALEAALGACGCAADWDQSRTESWWLEQAAARSSNTDTPQSASTTTA